VGVNTKGFGYRWHEFDERFNLDKHPNEINRFGWIVEIDPQNPDAKPIKRTALGRFKHEGAMVTVAKNRKIVVYMGDDQRNEYVYKFVSKRTFNPATPKDNLNLLDEGTLFVARYDADGLGRWIALEHNRNGLTAANGFPDQAYIAINPRLAADFVGATPMDRPEWIAVHPQTKDVYVTLTNNTDRGTKVNLNAANPRVSNSMGHIVRWTEANGDSSGTVFKWEIYTLAGDANSTSHT
jgi:secreted PhoX family phosphatase